MQKFDFVTRRHRDHGGLSFFADISLLLIDEVHLLSEPRGASLEAVISRMKMLARFPELKECPIARIRFIAVSATVPNIEDIGKFLSTKNLISNKFQIELQWDEDVQKIGNNTKASFGYIVMQRNGSKFLRVGWKGYNWFPDPLKLDQLHELSSF